LSETPLFSPLLDYVSASREEYLELFEDAPEHADPNYEEKWFDPSDALSRIETILAAIQTDSQSLPTPEGFEKWERSEWIELLTQDLETIRSQLQAAIKHGAKFHMEFCY
jgi:hypothetical protein